MWVNVGWGGRGDYGSRAGLNKTLSVFYKKLSVLSPMMVDWEMVQTGMHVQANVHSE